MNSVKGKKSRAVVVSYLGAVGECSTVTLVTLSLDYIKTRSVKNKD